MTPLPIPSAEAQNHSQQLVALIQQKIHANAGWINFADFMQMALYTPGLGYYSGGTQKFGKGGDFITAPEISPLFAQTIANQVAQALDITKGNILELGAGTGKLATDILLTLNELGNVPAHYYILEVSDDLRQVQREWIQEKLPKDLMQRVIWLDTLPQNFHGVVLANEVLDAIPVHLIHHTSTGLLECGVTVSGSEFVWQDVPLIDENLLNIINKLDLPQGYLTEVCPAASGLIASLANILTQGVILMVDYGFSANEYYHAQRDEGTLMCHYQQLSHANPLIYVGLQDITAHVDFTAVAQAAIDHGLQLSGYTSQAQFLMNCGILEVMSQTSPHDIAEYAPIAAAAQKLLSPAEMGDLFKVIALSRDVDIPLLGFSSGDKTHTL